jgi:uncharacterized membrane protein
MEDATMEDTTIARTIHVIAVVLWIGGVGFVTTVLLPAVRRIKSPAERLAFFDGIERRFAWQARMTTLLAGLSGLYILIRLDLWDRFLSARMWWMHAMVMVWLLFTLMLFVAEPFFLHRRLRERAEIEPENTFRAVERLHWLVLALSLITILGAVAGSHGLLLFG